MVLVSQFSGPLRAAERLASSKNWPCRTIDGATSLEARHDAQSRLNGAEDFFLLCLALRAGGVGLTLTGASRIILFEPSWNPSDDAQAIARVWRWGQRRETRVYRWPRPTPSKSVCLDEAGREGEALRARGPPAAGRRRCWILASSNRRSTRTRSATRMHACALGAGGVHVACAAARAADAARRERRGFRRGRLRHGRTGSP